MPKTLPPVAPTPGQPWTSISGIEFGWIPPGSFLMGSPEDEEGRHQDEGPQHPVTLSRGFWLGRTPVTQAEYQALTGQNPSYFKGECRPVGDVDHRLAECFCVELTRRERETLPEYWEYRLPTEAEWEYSCRAGTTGTRYGDLERIAWYQLEGGWGTRPVGQLQANPWGLCDMLGNVWEWCLDGIRCYGSRAETDPRGSLDSSHPVIRGGSWSDGAGSVRAANRYTYASESRSGNLGFRLVLGPSLASQG